MSERRFSALTALEAQGRITLLRRNTISRHAARLTGMNGLPLICCASFWPMPKPSAGAIHSLFSIGFNFGDFEIAQITYIAVEVVTKSFDNVGLVLSHFKRINAGQQMWNSIQRLP
ncbi:MAG: hypothetical protein HXY41_12735, partial [Chloroflexi bacterium]|nr:hypothetical protein [Chloroflexota bacterium]